MGQQEAAVDAKTNALYKPASVMSPATADAWPCRPRTITQGKALTEKRLASWVWSGALFLSVNTPTLRPDFHRLFATVPNCFGTAREEICASPGSTRNTTSLSAASVSRDCRESRTWLSEISSCLVCGLPWDAILCCHSRNLCEPGGKGLCRNCSVGLSRVSTQE